MKITSRAAVFAVFGAGSLLLAAGCGGSPSSATEATLVDIQPTSFVEVAPATTTTTTVAPTNTDPGRAPGAQAYTVRSGDSISKIAGLHDITMDQLVAYNSWTEGLNHFLQIGDVVNIPPGASVPGAATETADSGDTGSDSGDTGDSGTDAEPAPDGEGCTHTIAQDEFPNKVARQYDITTDELIAANPGGVMNTFLVGATLKIPANGNC